MGRPADDRAMRLSCILSLAAFGALITTAPAAAAPSATAAARGQIVKGLVHADRPGCTLFAGAKTGVCTHGPDLAPVGRDVRKGRAVATLRKAAGLTTPAGTARTTPGTVTLPADGSGAVVCDGDGVSGRRVQVLYVVAADRPDRFLALADALGQYTIKPTAC